MVFFNKKEVTLEYTPIRLERRHTMAEGGLDVDKSRTSRTNSVNSLSERTKSIESLEHGSRTSLSEDRRNTFSAAPSVVITENELSSSWLYKSQKAHVNANTGISPKSKTQMSSSSLENLLPEARQDPCISTSVPMEHHDRKRSSSCCCCATIVTIIFFTSLGILAAIGGIVYMEIFAVQDLKDKHTVENSSGIDFFNNSVQKSASGHRNENQLDKSLPIEVKKNEFFEETPPTTINDSKTDILPDGSSTEFQRKFGDESNLHTLKNVNDAISLTNQIKPVSSSENIHKNLDSNVSSEKVKVNFSNIMSRHDVVTEIPNLKIFEISREIENGLHERLLIDENGNANLSIHIDPQNKKEHEEIAGSKETVDRNASNSNFGNEQKMSEPDEFMLPDFEEQPISNFGKHDTDYVNTAEVFNEDPSLSVSPSLHSTTESIVLLSTETHGLEVSNQFLDMDDSSDILNFGGHNESSPDSDFDRLSPMNRTVDDANALPLEFFRRLGFNEDYIANHPALTVEDMNVKFSLAEALKYLRSLDANDKHPTARLKTVTPESNKKRSERRLNIDNGEERKRYLQKLRRTIFD